MIILLRAPKKVGFLLWTPVVKKNALQVVSWAHIQNQRHMNFQKITLKTKIYSQNLSQSPKDPPPPIWSFSSSGFVIWPVGANMICETKKSSRHWRFWMTKQGDENDQIGGGPTFLGVRSPASLIKWGGEPVYISLCSKQKTTVSCTENLRRHTLTTIRPRMRYWGMK